MKKLFLMVALLCIATTCLAQQNRQEATVSLSHYALSPTNTTLADSVSGDYVRLAIDITRVGEYNNYPIHSWGVYTYVDDGIRLKVGGYDWCLPDWDDDETGCCSCNGGGGPSPREGYYSMGHTGVGVACEWPTDPCEEFSGDSSYCLGVMGSSLLVAWFDMEIDPNYTWPSGNGTYTRDITIEDLTWPADHGVWSCCGDSTSITCDTGVGHRMGHALGTESITLTVYITEEKGNRTAAEDPITWGRIKQAYRDEKYEYIERMNKQEYHAMSRGTTFEDYMADLIDSL